MKAKKHSFFIIRRGDKRLSERITAEAGKGNIFSSISPFGVITFVKGEPSAHTYRLEDPDLPKDLRLYDKDIFEEVFRSKSYVVFRSKKAAPEYALVETASYEAWEYEAETGWLAQKAAEGLLLYKKQGENYYFVKEKPRALDYRIDYQIIKNPREYLEGFNAQGWEFVCSVKNDHYFCRPQTQSKKHGTNAQSVKPQIAAIGKKIRLRWFLFLWLFAMFTAGLVFAALGFFTEKELILRKIILYGAGAFLGFGALSIFFAAIKGYIFLRRKNRLLKYRGE